MLVAQGLLKCFGSRAAVDHIDLDIAAGEVYGLLGPNGAGKTTAISMIAGILDRDGGTITVDGVDIDAGPPARARIGLVTQWLTLYTDLTGIENLEFWGRLYGVRGRALDTAVSAALDAVGLADRASDPVSSYSGGMQRRLNLAAGLIHDPKLLVLDEPTVGVDPQSRNAIFELIERLRAEGMAIVYTTHYMEEAQRLCDRVGIIDAGCIIAEGSPRDLVGALGDAPSIVIGFGEVHALGPAADLLGSQATVEGAVVADGKVRVSTGAGGEHIPKVVSVLLDAGYEPTSVEILEPDLEDVFLSLTGKALRD